MSATTIRVTPETHKLLRELSGQEGLPMPALVHKAVLEYRRRRILAQGNLAYAAVRAEPAAWAEELEERAAWESTVADGLDGDHRW